MIDLNIDAENFWMALVKVCASTRPEDHHKVATLVKVRKSDIRAALKIINAQINL